MADSTEPLLSEDQNKNQSRKKTKLYLPTYCTIPQGVKECKNLSGQEKIFFGELSVLAGSRGYLEIDNKELARLKDVSEKTICRYLANIEKNNFILRDSKSYQILKDGKRNWKNERKIYINHTLAKTRFKKSLGKDISDPPFRRDISDPPFRRDIPDPSSQSEREKKNNNQEADSEESHVVVFLLENGVTKKSIFNSGYDLYPLEEAKRLVKDGKEWAVKTGRSIKHGINTALGQRWPEKYKNPEEKNSEWADKNLSHLDGKETGKKVFFSLSKESFSISIPKEATRVYFFSDILFIQKVKEELGKI